MLLKRYSPLAFVLEVGLDASRHILETDTGVRTAVPVESETTPLSSRQWLG